MYKFIGQFSVNVKLWGVISIALICMILVAGSAVLELKSSLLDDRKIKTRNLVEVAHSLIGFYGSKVASQEMSETQAKATAIAAIKALHYEGNEYFWINDMHPNMVMHPYKPDLDGKDISNIKDPEGTALFVEFVNKVKSQGEGYVSYMWPKPGESSAAAKISFVKSYEPWGWVIGSGIYIDDVDEIFYQKVTEEAIYIILSGFILIVLSIAIIGNINKPLQELLSVMSDVQQNGNLTRRANVEQKDEIGTMASSFNEMMDGLKKFMNEVKHAAAQVDQSSVALLSITVQNSEGMSTQKQQTEQTATAMHEMSATVQEVTQNTSLAANAAQQANVESTNGKQVVDTTIHSINKLASEVDKASGVIQGLEGDVNNISNVLDVIRGIAEQTNLLALNAAIEAARAGEQGRGFAVVADEVRTLAQRTQDATQEIQSMIENLQTATFNAVDVMKVGHSQAANSVEQAAQAGVSLQNIATSVSQITEMNIQIASSSEEQSAVAEEISKNVIHIRDVADRTYDSTQELKDTGDQLNNLSKMLKGLLDKYVV